MLVGLALSAIRGYQRHLSPHKGYCCAYRCATGRGSCSAHGYRVIGRFGLWTGLALLRRRLRLCGETYPSRILVRNPVLYHQRGDCVPCDCDAACLPDLPCSGKSAARGAGECLGECGCDVLEHYLEKKYERAKERWHRWRERRRAGRRDRPRR
ncbi:MAG: membrane protein insertion efficiency factor YidD [Pseudomonadota bacterium]